LIRIKPALGDAPAVGIQFGAYVGLGRFLVARPVDLVWSAGGESVSSRERFLRLPLALRRRWREAWPEVRLA
jgi:hypothetical protein